MRHALIVSVVHNPLDARIHFRQIAALVQAGWQVTQVAPWRDFDLDPAAAARIADATPGVYETVDVARASGRDRRRARADARRVLARIGPAADVVVLHDPELLTALPAGCRGPDAPPVVWDVHEDTAGALADKGWVPRWLRLLVAPTVRLAERAAERRVHLLLAEEDYQARFAGDHPVIPNHPLSVPETVDEPGNDRVVHLGRISRGRGVSVMLAAARQVRHDVTVELIGRADDDVRGELRAAVDDGIIEWSGFVPNDRALARLNGAAAGLSLLADTPNYRASRPTKILEYLAHGVPAITTPLPRAADIVENHDCGLVVDFDDVEATVGAIRRLVGDRQLRERFAHNGHAAAREHYNWQTTAPRFVQILTKWADG